MEHAEIKIILAKLAVFVAIICACSFAAFNGISEHIDRNYNEFAVSTLAFLEDSSETDASAQ